MKKILGVIPARWASTRFPGKVLALIAGKPMIQHVWEQAKQSTKLTDVIIAADDEQVLQAAKKFGAQAVLTDVNHASGTDRIAQAVKDLSADIIINIQGDEPLIRPEVIDSLIAAFDREPACLMATAIKKINDVQELNNPNIVKVVIDCQYNALYFSRALIPYNRDNGKTDVYKHQGIYAYQRDFLLKIVKLPPSKLEQSEKLEQLRVLEAGYKIKTVETDYESIGVDSPEDIGRVEEILKKR
ncbi:MAG: 3-deoxy-manno-octulosonate cytidylyltransferase [Candidatus Omnitrophica bacterium]|nr:3-deoxy-manno-octulosonate cytidylyltransferase [Candidatus Omnitrophota bacterium]MCB9746864.1 3-deoxy-manno-octulosonate cytidylyltransferase [Candidatus Omnitrophota bacterium]